ncbi:kinetochore protein Spc25 isoform X2 [Chelonia mydas]|uniref:kinetochore protein Spc25 isoform X2 n=1 Tax=Chelonia mydas TaxID=8469 RepID=UPI001CA96F71|nr:kinetochore protein Spc25 isoform X2 [Chelonia mydas]
MLRAAPPIARELLCRLRQERTSRCVPCCWAPGGPIRERPWWWRREGGYDSNAGGECWGSAWGAPRAVKPRPARGAEEKGAQGPGQRENYSVHNKDLLLDAPGEKVTISTMSQIKTEDELILFEKEIKEFWTKFKSICGSEHINQTLGLRESCKESIKALSEKWSKKLKEGDLMIDKILEYRNEILQQNISIEEKQKDLTEMNSKIKHEEEQKRDFIDRIQELKEELTRKKEIISAKNKATKERLERLSKSKELFEERLGLEIRRIYDEQLQFIFRCIDHKDPDKPYTFTLSINEQGDYEVTSSSPPLDCIAELQLKVRETNNFAAFVANIRKAFTALSYK